MTVVTTGQTTRSDVAAAWDEYREAIHGQSPEQYEKIEPHAWERLKSRLRGLGVRLDGGKRGGD